VAREITLIIEGIFTCNDEGANRKGCCTWRSFFRPRSCFSLFIFFPFCLNGRMDIGWSCEFWSNSSLFCGHFSDGFFVFVFGNRRMVWSWLRKKGNF